MNRTLFVILLACSAFPNAFAQPTGRLSGNGRPDKEILFLERQRFDAMIKQDSMLLKQILADDLQYTHSNGQTDTKAAFLNTLFSGKTVYRSIRTEGVQVRDYGNTTVVTGLANVNVVTEGKEKDLRLRYTDVYVKRNGRWQMVAWQSTRILPPESTK